MTEKKKLDIEVLQSIICDEIRREDNGKFILIGVYPDDIFMNSIPANLVLSVWMQCRLKLKEKKSLDFQIIGDCLQVPITFVSEIGDEKIFNKNVIMPIIIKIQLVIKGEGSFFIKYKISGDKNWIPVNEMSIKKNRVVAANS